MDVGISPKFEIPGWGDGDEYTGPITSFSQIAALLCSNSRPYGGHTIDEVAEMNSQQLVNVFLRPSDEATAKKGGYWPVPNTGLDHVSRYESGGCSFDAMFAELYGWRGCSEDEIQLRWREYVEANPQLAHSVPTEQPMSQEIVDVRHEPRRDDQPQRRAESWLCS